ncbi:MAG: OsmC family protein [Pseudomonadota bacterium]
MSHEYRATIRWAASGDVLKGHYSRAHEWEFDGGTVVPASASPGIVPLPWSDESAVDPEEAFVASLSSCHMLFFVDFARRAGFAPATYADDAVGVMTKAGDGRMWVSRVELNPVVTWSSEAPSQDDLRGLHHRAHDACFIANSVRTEVVTNLT